MYHASEEVRALLRKWRQRRVLLGGVGIDFIPGRLASQMNACIVGVDLDEDLSRRRVQGIFYMALDGQIPDEWYAHMEQKVLPLSLPFAVWVRRDFEKPVAIEPVCGTLVAYRYGLRHTVQCILKNLARRERNGEQVLQTV